MSMQSAFSKQAINGTVLGITAGAFTAFVINKTEFKIGTIGYVLFIGLGAFIGNKIGQNMYEKTVYKPKENSKPVALPTGV